MMSIDGAVDLVVYSFENGRPGDLFVQKAPAATVGNLAKALKRIFKVDNPITIIGTRHGEKLYETLLTREEMLRVTDLGEYYRVSADNRDLNYEHYYSEGVAPELALDEYNSHNTHRLSVDELEKMLMELDFIKENLNSALRQQ
jgi:UDP-glucose 4-epimerase